jgi:feruloyl esterase
MLVHAPEHLPTGAPLVVALHGCSQDAEEFNHGTGWSELADRLGFLVVYPEQQPSNNPKNCFSWFSPGDTTRGSGEALSIHQMIQHAIETLGADRERVFVTGLSAGGAMAAVMLATYPDTFAAGAIIAGLPYGCARSVNEAFEAMFTERHSSPRVLGDRVRAASKHHGPWPKISVWHGSADPIVKSSNAEQIIRQWTDVQSLSATPSYEELIGAHTRHVWNDPNGDTLVESFSISGMGHGVPLALNTDAESCGAAGPFFLDAGISSTHYIAHFWGLADRPGVASGVPTIVSEPVRIPAIVARTEREKDNRTDSSTSSQARPNLHPEPSDVIAAAFKAAGLQFLQPQGGSTRSQFNPGPIIEAALKAAGFKRT